MQTEYTPVVDWQVSSNPATVTGRREGQPYRVVVAECPGYQQDRERHARLIAAAPEMLAALTAYQAFIEARFTKTVRDLAPEWYETFTQAAKAIAKAEGAA